MSGSHGKAVFQPGDHVRWYATSCGWNLARRTVIVEGQTDVSYLTLAAERYREQTGLQLLNSKFSVVASGVGDEGGTYGLVEKFPALRQLIEHDCSPSGRPLFRVAALVDNDNEGNRACQYLTGRYTNFLKHRDVFVLHRVLPRESQDPKVIDNIIKAANASWSSMDCEIEDLISLDAINAFLSEYGTALRRPLCLTHGAFHVDLTNDGKADLCRWMKDIAELNDLLQIVEVLKSLRYYFGLNVDGD